MSLRAGWLWPLAVIAAMCLQIAAPVHAQPTATPEDARQAERAAAWRAAEAVAQVGPREVELLDQARLAVPARTVFIPAKEANRVMVAMGNTALDTRLGMIVPQDQKAQWLIDITWTKEGYVRDGDAKEWQPDAMLDSLKEGTEEANKDREARGFTAIDIVGWVQEPTYDAKTNQLVWSLAARDRGSAGNQPQTINYNTYALGREGYISLDLITGSDTIATDKAAVHTVLANLQFSPGKRYADFNASTDKVAAYGLAGLVGAVAIKKLGLLAALGVFLLKIWKLALIAMLGGWAALKNRLAKLFGRAPPEETHADEAVEAEPEPEVEPATAADAPPQPDSGEHP